jgi:SecD/SecF fusion protein
MLDVCLGSGINLLAQAEVLPFWQTSWFVFILVVAAIALAFWLGQTITQSLRTPEYSTRVTMIFLAIFLATIVLGYGKLRFGVDLRGGVTYIGQVDLPDDSVFKIEDLIPKLVQRVDPSGTREIMIRSLSRDKIEVTIPDVDMADADNIWNRLVRTGHLEFRIVAASEHHSTIINRALEKLNSGDLGQNVTMIDSAGIEKTVARWVNIARVEPEIGQKFDPHAPFKFIPSANHLVRDKDTGKLIEMSRVPFSRVIDRQGAELAAYSKAQGYRNVQVLVIEPETEELDVQGRYVTNASPTTDEMGRRAVSFKFDSIGAARMGALTTRNRAVGDSYRQLAIVLDDQLQSAPRIESPIHRNGQITGSFTEREVTDLCVNLNSGKIEVALNKAPISKEYVKSTLGEDLKNKGIFAAAISLVVVMIFMLLYYGWFAGLVTCAALALNLLLTIAFVIAIQQPLTLTGIAGLVLTVGMAVDANVLIFERIREELAKGSSLRMAINNGYDRATVTIIDSNVTTLITAFVLYVIGTEQLKGFSVTLILGILFSMFTAVYCARAIFEIAERRRMIKSLNFRDLLGSKVFDFLGKTGLALGFSLLLLIGTVAGMWALGKRILDIDLKGGSTARVVFNEAINRADITAALSAKDMVVNKEKITFIVSEMDDQEFAGRSFKIDSNLPSPEDGDDWQTLDQVIEETFRGKLRLNGVNFDPAAIKVEELDVERKSGAVTFPNRQLHQIGNLLAAGGFSRQGLMHTVMSYQPRQDQDNEEQAGAEAGNAEGNNAEQDQAQVDASQDELPGATGGDFFNQEPQAPGRTVIQSKRYVTSAKLNFENPITPRTLKSFLTEYASQIDVPLEEDQIKVLDDDGIENEVSAKSWTVKIETRAENDAKRVLEKYKSVFNELVYFPASSGVGGQIAGYAQVQAIVAIFVSFLGIVVYVWIRFQNIAFGLAAVIALIHDVMVVLGAIALSNFVAGYFGFLLIDNFKISLTVLAAILTVIGYSLNDTIVIFDRIREVRGKRRELTAEMVNFSLSQTLGRTILTSFTTFIVVLILYIRGGDSIHAFAFSLVVGVLVGTYSTIFIASPALVWLMDKFGYHLEEPEAAKS